LLAILLVTVIWGWTFVWMKQATSAGAVWLAAVAPSCAPGAEFATQGALCVIGLFIALRFGASMLLLPLFSRGARSGLDAQAWRGGLLLGSFLLSGFLLQMLGLQSVSASISAFLTSLYVLFTAAMIAWGARRLPAPRLLFGALLATLGAAFIGGPPRVGWGVGEWFTVGSAFIFALHIVYTDRITKRSDPMAVTMASLVVVAVGSFALAGFSFSGEHAPPIAQLGSLISAPDFLVPLVCSTFFATLLALSLMNLFQRELNPVRAAILYALEPVWAAMVAIGGGSEVPNRWLYIGGGVLLLGNLVAEGFGKRPPALTPPQGNSPAD
jgi:drug/metabolite transporter (DMT)-like permease